MLARSSPPEHYRPLSSGVLVSRGGTKHSILQIQQTFDIPRFARVERKWSSPRGLLFFQDVEVLIDHAQKELGEVREVLDTKTFDVLKAWMENIDVSWLLLKAASQYAVRLDALTILRGMTVVKSDVFEKLEEAMRNVKAVKEHPTTFKRELEHTFSLVLSLAARLPAYIDPNLVVHIVLAKNTANYPVFAFNDIHPLTGEQLTESQREQKRDHSRSSFRYIRDHLVTEMGWDDRTLGLNPSDWMRYVPLINGFEDADHNYGRLHEQVRHDYIPGFTPHEKSALTLLYATLSNSMVAVK